MSAQVGTELHRSNSTNRRKNTKSDMRDSKRELEQRLTEDKHKRLMYVIMRWANQLGNIRIISISKSFYKWRYSTIVTTQGTVPISAHVGEQKNYYLQLFAENEKLREQLIEIRRSTISAEKSTRYTAVGTMICVILRARTSQDKRRYFDLWLYNASMVKEKVLNGQKTMMLEVGLQQIESERGYVRTIETNNTHLKLTLAMTLYYFKWKSKTAMASIGDERKLYDTQRKILFAELLRIREAVSKANQREASLLHNAIARGDDVSHNLVELHSQLNSIVSLHNETEDKSQAKK